MLIRKLVAERFSRWWSMRGTRELGDQEGAVRLPHERAPGAAPDRELDVFVRGVIRSEVYLLTQYGTVYGLYDYPTAGYDCALKSDAYRLGEYVGDNVEVTGTLTGVSREELPVMNVAHLRLLGAKWMR